MLEQQFTLPYPPSVNEHTASITVWSRKKNKLVTRRIKTRVCRQYQKDAVNEILLQRKQQYSGMVEVKVAIYPPDRRRRDTDNILKAVFDALTKGGVIKDDYFIQKHGAERFDKELLNHVKITVIPREQT